MRIIKRGVKKVAAKQLWDPAKWINTLSCGPVSEAKPPAVHALIDGLLGDLF